MAQTKISELSAHTTTDGAEELLINDGGTSKKVTIANLLHDNSIDSDHYVDGSIDTAHLAADAITGAKIADDAIGTEHMAANSVTGSEITANAVDSEHYTDGSIDNAHIADNAIDSEHYADGSIDTAHLADDVINEHKLAAGAVVTAAINDDAVTAAKMADDSVLEAAIGANAVVTAAINDDAVTAAKLANAINTSIDAKLPLAGGTMTGALTIDNSNNAAVISTFATDSSDAAVVKITNEEGTDHTWGVAVAGSSHAAGENSFYIRDETAGANRIIINDSGNVGIGVVPEANWRATSKALDIGATGALWDDYAYTILGNNIYEHTDTNRKHKADGYSSYINQYQGNIYFTNTTSGTADATISETTRMTINSLGNVGIGDTAPSEAKLSIDNVLAGDIGLQIVNAQATKGLSIDQNGDARALHIDCESTNDNAVEMNGRYTLRVNQDISDGRAAYFYRDIAEAGAEPLVSMINEHSSNTQPSLFIKQDGAGRGISIDQNGDGTGIYIDSEADSNSIELYCRYGLYIDQNISDGRAAYFIRNIAEAGSNPLVQIIDNHTSNTQAALKIQQDGAGYGLQIDHNGNYTALSIDSTSTSTGGVIEVTANSLTSGRVLNVVSNGMTTGSLAQFYSNSSDTGTRDLVRIHNDHASATGTTALHVKQDSTGAAAVFDGNVGIGTDSPAKPLNVKIAADGTLIRLGRNGVCDWDFSIGNTPTLTGVAAGGLELLPQNANTYFAIGLAGTTTALMHVKNTGTDIVGDIKTTTGNLVIGTAGKGIDFSATSDGTTMSSELFDDYEEGNYDVAVTAAGSGSITISGTYEEAAYTKIGRVVHVQGYCDPTALSSPVGAIRISLPFTSANLGNLSGWAVGNIISWGMAFSGYLALRVTEGVAYAVIVDANTGGTPRVLVDEELTLADFHFSITYIAA